MENHDVLTLTPVPHPDGRVQRVGFDLTDPYVEQCWGPGDRAERNGPVTATADAVDRTGAGNDRA
jgi:hypothetical protein